MEAVGAGGQSPQNKRLALSGSRHLQLSPTNRLSDWSPVFPLTAALGTPERRSLNPQPLSSALRSYRALVRGAGPQGSQVSLFSVTVTLEMEEQEHGILNRLWVKAILQTFFAIQHQQSPLLNTFRGQCWACCWASAAGFFQAKTIKVKGLQMSCLGLTSACAPSDLESAYKGYPGCSVSTGHLCLAFAMVVKNRL